MAVKPTFSGEMQLAGFADGSRGGPRLTLRLADRSELEIARGPHFQASMRAGKLTTAYREQLAAVDPDPVKANAEVKAAAKTVWGA